MPDKILDSSRQKQMVDEVQKMMNDNYNDAEIGKFISLYKDKFGTDKQSQLYGPSETPEQKKRRYDNVKNNDATSLATNYDTESKKPLEAKYINGNFVGVDMESKSQYLQSREGKAGEIVSNYINKNKAAKEDLKYLNQVAPLATAQIVASVIPGVAKKGKADDADIEAFIPIFEKNKKEASLNNQSAFYKDINTKALTELTTQGFDPKLMSSEAYLTQFRNGLEEQRTAEIGKLQSEFPIEFVPQTAPGYVGPAAVNRNKEYYAAEKVLNEKYDKLFDSLGRAAASNISDKDELTVGLEYLKYKDPGVYKNRIEVTQSADDRTWAEIGSQVKIAKEQDLNAVEQLINNQDKLDEKYTGRLEAETRHRLGAELYKGDNWFLNFNQSIEAKDKAAEQLPQKYRDAYNKYVRPKEIALEAAGKFTGNIVGGLGGIFGAVAGTDIPNSGAINQLVQGAEGVATSGVLGVMNMRGTRSRKDVIQDMLDSPYKTRNQNVGEMPQAKARLNELNNRLKAGETLDVNELHEKSDLETFTNVRGTVQKAIDGSFNLLGQVIMQGAGTKGLGGLMGLGLKSAGLLKTAQLASGLANEYAISANIGLSQSAVYNIAGAAVAFTSSYDDANQQAIRLYPDDENKQAIYTTAVAGLNALTERLFPDEKIFGAFKKEVSPNLAKLVNQLGSGELKKELLFPTLKGIIKDGLKFGKYATIENTKETAEELATSLGTSLTNLLLSPSKFNFNEAYDDAVNTVTTMFTDGALVALFAGAKEFRANRLGINTLSQIGVNQSFTEDLKGVIAEQVSSGALTQAQADEKLKVINTIAQTNTVDMPQVVEGNNLKDREVKKYAIALSYEKLLQDKINTTTDEALKAKYQDDIFKSKELRKKILNKEVFVDDSYEVLTPEEAKAKEDAKTSTETVAVMPTADVLAQETKDGKVVTYTYATQDEIPEEFKNRITDVKTENGKDVITVSVPLSLDNYIKNKNATTTSQGQEQESTTTGDISQREGTQGEQNQTTTEASLGDSDIEGEGQGISVKNLIGKVVSWNGFTGTLFQEGQTLSIETTDGKIIREVGNVDELSNQSPEDIGMVSKESLAAQTETGFSINGEEVFSTDENLENAVSLDQNGNIKNVVLTTKSGKRRKFRGALAEDLAYQITLQRIYNEQKRREAFEQYLKDKFQAELDAAEAKLRAEQDAAKQKSESDAGQTETTTEEETTGDNVGVPKTGEGSKVVPAFGVITPDNLEELDKIKGNKLQTKVLNDIKGVVKAIAALVNTSTGKKLTVSIHNQETFTQAVIEAGGSKQDATARGFYMDRNGSIHLNFDNLATDTMLHEGFHPVLDFLQKNNPKIIDEFFAQLEAIPGAKSIIKNARDNYSGDTNQKKEAITDFVAAVADGRVELNASNTTKFFVWLNNIYNKIGLGSIFPKLIAIDSKDSRSQLVQLAEGISSAFTNGIPVSAYMDVIGEFDENKPTSTEPIATSGQLQFMRTIYDKSKIEKSPALDKDEFKQAVADKRISVVNPYESLDGKFFAITFPDDFFTGEIKYDNETIAYGNGGVFFAAKFGGKGDMWAAAGENSANNFVIQGNNSRLKNNGEGLVLLSKGEDIKFSTSLEANIALINTIIKYADKNNQLASAIKAIKTTYTVGGAKSSNKIIESFNEYLKGGRGESGQRMIDAKNAFNMLSSSLIKDAGPLMTNMLRDMGFDGPTYFDKAKLKKGEYVATTQGVKAMYVDLLQEDFLKGLNNGAVYAALRFDSDIKYEEDKYHPSYPLVIKTVDGSPIRLEVFSKTFNSYGKEGVAIYGQERNNENAFGVATTTKPDFKLDKKFEDNPAQRTLSEGLKKYEAFSGLQLQRTAPNGKPSKLNAKQYEQVRTPAFKKWFGDWEKDPKNASKIVDKETGEPLVVYHATNATFDEFKLEKPTIGAYGQGFYASNDSGFASNYAKGEGAQMLSLFLNIKNPFEFNQDNLPSGYEKYSDMNNNKGLSRDFTKRLISEKYDGVYAKDEQYNENELVSFGSNQLKSATANTGEFSTEDNRIQFQKIPTRSKFNFNIKKEIDRIKSLGIAAEDGDTRNLDGTKYTKGGLVIPASSVNTTQGRLNGSSLFDFLNKNKSKVSNGNSFKIGLYKFPDKNTVSIDLNIVSSPKNRAIAIEFARLAGQESIYDLDTKQNIKTGADGMSPIKFSNKQFAEIGNAFAENRMPNVFGDTQYQKSKNESGKTMGFFSDVVKGISDKYKPIKEWTPLLTFNGVQSRFKNTYDKYLGNFDLHIATSIPTFRETQVKVGNAIVGLLSTPARSVNKDLENVKNKYQEKNNLKTKPAYTKVNAELFKDISNYHSKVKDDRKNPAMAKSYNAFLDETLKQYQSLVDAGYKIEPWLEKGEPYGVNSAEMRKDVVENKHLYYLRSKSATGESNEDESPDNYAPFRSTGIVINGDDVLFNDLFRAVHDIFGHGMVSNTFSTQGEFDAYNTHSPMYSETAQKALFLETVVYNAYYATNKAYAQRKIYDIPNKFLTDTKPLIYDIGGSEGGFVKSITESTNGRVNSINLDPNSEMKQTHEATPVKGSKFVQEAFLEGFEENGVYYPAHKPENKADVVHESMVFQFITPEREAFIKEVANNYLKDGGLFITEQKFSQNKEEYDKNEKKKAAYKDMYYTKEQQAMKSDDVLVGMKENQADLENYKKVLADNFKYVKQYWDSGNFKGFVASNSEAAMKSFMDKIGSTESEFTTTELENNLQFQRGTPTRKVGLRTKSKFVNRVSNKLERIRQNLFTVSGVLGKTVKVLQEKMAGNIAAEINKAERLGGNTKKLIQKYKNVITTQQVTDYLTGVPAQPGTPQMPQSLAMALDEMREHIDGLTEQLITLGVIDDVETIALYRENKGKYMLRSYELFNAPTGLMDKANGNKMPEIDINNAISTLRNLDQAVIDNALMYLANQEMPRIQTDNPTLSLAEQFKLAKKSAKTLVNEILARDEVKYSTKSVAGSVNVKSISERQDIAPEIRALMGEYTDPIYNYYSTIYKIATLTSSRDYLNKLKDVGYNKFLFDENSPNRPTDASKPIAAKESEFLRPLNGLYTFPEMKKALEMADAESQNMYRQLAGRVRKYKTVYNPATHIVNVIGNAGFAMSNGHWNELSETYDALSGYLSGSDSPKIVKLIDTLNREGVLGNSVGVNELKQYFDKNKSLDDLLKVTYGAASKVEKVAKGLTKARLAVEKAYQIEDDVFKILAFVNESNRYAKAFYSKKYMELNPTQMADISDKAGEIVKNTYPTWSRVPKFVKRLSKELFLGNFLSFPAESIRTSYNTLELAMKELASGNGKLRAVGFTRLVGTLAYNGAFSALNYYGFSLAGAGITGLIGAFADDDEEKKKKKQIMQQVAPWNQESADLYVSSFKDGKLVYYDIGRLNSFKYQSDVFGTFFSNMGNKEGAIKSSYRTVAKALEPVFDVDLTYDALIAMKNNEVEETGQKIYNPEEGDKEFGKSTNRAIQYGKFMMKKFGPGVVTNAMKLYDYYGKDSDKFKDELVSTFGPRKYTVDLAQNFYFNLKGPSRTVGNTTVGFSERLEDAKKLYNRYDKSLSEGEQEVNYQKAVSAYKEVLADAREYYLGAVSGGTPTKELKKKLLISKIGGTNNRVVLGTIISKRDMTLNDNAYIRR